MPIDQTVFKFILQLHFYTLLNNHIFFNQCMSQVQRFVQWAQPHQRTIFKSSFNLIKTNFSNFLFLNVYFACFWKIFIFFKSKILHSQFNKKTIKKWRPKNLPFFFQHVAKFCERKLLILIGLYVTYNPVTFQQGLQGRIFLQVKLEKVITINQVKKIFLN